LGCGIREIETKVPEWRSRALIMVNGYIIGGQERGPRGIPFAIERKSFGFIDIKLSIGDNGIFLHVIVS
jgi:hypothetical protein